ncbi:MAG TPA: protease modulator HflC [Gemmataceae bacterium]|nr:protease modulator HflC [Gemmataceae bacterium]
MRWKLIVLLVLILAAIVAPLCAFTVDRTEFVYLTQFGRHLDPTYDGRNDEQAGLHFKWPWPIQSVQRLDRRLQYFDLPGAELLTRDPQRKTIDRTLTIDAYICWRIADAEGVDKFIRSVGTPAGAQAILGQRITSELGAAIGQMELDDLISTDPNRVEDARKKLRTRLLEGGSKGGPSLEDVARSEYGIKMVDIRLRRSNHPPAVRDAIFQRIISERKKKVADYESDGIRMAANIKSDGDRRIKILKAESEGRSIELKEQAKAEADRIRSTAQSKDPEFYTFLKKLEEYQRILGDNKSTLLLSTHRGMFDTLFNPPRPDKDKNIHHGIHGTHGKKTEEKTIAVPLGKPGP